ncbi:MAG: EpsD family peptidyl-prolyl cis-trans isomerase [Betaproteobacteria bacterium]
MKLVLIALLALVPLGCERAAAERAPGVVAAKVNGVEISLPQGDLRTARRMENIGQALEKVIARELLAQAALHEGLERDPEVAESIENARREVLARAWLERKALQDAKDSHRVAAFYAENPALFAERRIYRLNELIVSAPAELVEALRAEIEGAADLEVAAARLRARNLRFTSAALTAPAEKLPLAYLPRLARMKAGEVAVFAAPAGTVVVQVAQVEEAPLAFEQAAPLIEQFLAGKQRLEVAQAEVKRLREAARIEYVGDFKAR